MVSTSKVPRSLTGQPRLRKTCDNMKIRKDVALLPTRTLFFTSFFPPNMSNFSPLCLKEGIICLTVCPNPFFFLLTLRLMRKTMMERNEKFKLTNTPKARKNTTRRKRRRRTMGRLLLRNHSEELKCSCTPSSQTVISRQIPSKLLKTKPAY